MESTLSADKNRLAGQQQQQTVQQHQQPKVELVEEDVSNSINEASSSYEQHCSPSGQQLQQLGAQHLEPSFQSVKATKSVLFDTRSTTHAHNKKVQSGKKKKNSIYKISDFLVLYASVNVRASVEFHVFKYRRYYLKTCSMTTLSLKRKVDRKVCFMQ